MQPHPAATEAHDLGLAHDLATLRQQALGRRHGLGLYITNELARREGATLSLHNRPDGGLRAELRWRSR